MDIKTKAIRVIICKPKEEPKVVDTKFEDAALDNLIGGYFQLQATSTTRYYLPSPYHLIYDGHYRDPTKNVFGRLGTIIIVKRDPLSDAYISMNCNDIAALFDKIAEAQKKGKIDADS